MNTVYEILEAYARGEISVSQCWDQLAGIREDKGRSKTDIVLTAPPSKIYEPLNKYEVEAIRCLQGVHFGASRAAGRFAHDVKDQTELTARQREFLRGLVWRYRRQVFGGTDYDQRAQSFIERMEGSDHD